MNRSLRTALSTKWLLPLFLLLLVGGFLPARAATQERPNVVFILADDLGWADTTLYGHTRFYRTPNLERLAKRGMVFTRAYSVSPLCSPTRASILSGQNPARTGITAPNCHLPKVQMKATVREKGSPKAKALICDSATRFDTNCVTLTERLKEAGYATGHFGKWHLGPEPWSPLQQGFDVDVPHHAGPGPAGSYVAPWKFKHFDADPDEPDQHIEDRMAKEAVAWMERHRDGPFFLNYWMFSVHAPFDAKQALMEEYKKRADPTDPQRSPTYAAMVGSMDDAVGTLLDALDRLGIAERTAVVFYSDNGGNMYSKVDGTVPTSNAPLRGGKATMFEGGIRVPAIVSWPGVTQRGSRSDAMIQSTDFYPTILGLLGLAPTPDHPLDGVDFASALRGEPFEHGPMFTFFPHQPKVPDNLPPSVSVHRGDWKLIRLFHQGEGGSHAHLLFNLEEDIGETNNVAAQQPALVAELDTLIQQFLADTKAVVPRPNPAYEAETAGGKGAVPSELDAEGPEEAPDATLSTEGVLIDKVWSGHPVGFDLLTDRGHQFIAYYDVERRITVAGRRLGETNWTYVQPEGVWVTNRNRMSNVTGWDSHNYLTLTLDREGCLHLSGNMHGDPLVYYRTREPFHLTTLERIDRMTGEREARATYPRFFTNAAGDLCFKYRDGGSGNGGDLYNIYDPATRTWRRLFDGPLLDGEGERSAYGTGPRRGPDGLYHMLWMWRDTPDAMSNHTLSYARSRDLVQWENSAGKPIPRPITMAGAEVVDPAQPGEGLINMTYALGWDAQHRPVAAYHRYDTHGHSQIFVARADDQGNWQTRQLSDWTFRWEFPGYGSQVQQVSVGVSAPDADGHLVVSYSSRRAGAGRWRLDGDTLAVLEQLPAAKQPGPESARKSRLDFPGIEMRTQTSWSDGWRWVLRWETLGVNRDLANRDVPPPSELRLYAIPDQEDTANP